MEELLGCVFRSLPSRRCARRFGSRDHGIDGLIDTVTEIR
jgi:hypothetical protein